MAEEINPVIRLAQVVSDIDTLQAGIADLENRMDASILGTSGEDETAIRFQLTSLKASLGEARNQESFWRSQVEDDKNDRKSQGELAKG